MSPSTRGSTSRTSALTKLRVISPCGVTAAACAGTDPISVPLPEIISARELGNAGVGLATSGSCSPRDVSGRGDPDAAAAGPKGACIGGGAFICASVHAETQAATPARSAYRKRRVRDKPLLGATLEEAD